MEKQTHPKISIIVPVYKVEKYLNKCVESILSQTYKNFELILVDDGSPDNCPKICDEFAKQDNRIVVIHKENGGLSDARNAGLNIARGEYIGFVDSDDYIAPTMYETLLNQLLTDQSDVAICNYMLVYESGEILNSSDLYHTTNSRFYTPKEFVTELFSPHAVGYVIAWSKLYRKDIFNKLRFPYGKQHEDEFIFHYVISQCRKISCIEDSLYYYRQREDSIMSQKFNVRRLDYGDALIDRYYFTKKNKIDFWKDGTVYRLSCELEKWSLYAKDDEEIRKKYNELRKRSRFLLFEKDAWKTYNFKGKLNMKIQLISPRLAEFIRKLYN